MPPELSDSRARFDGLSQLAEVLTKVAVAFVGISYVVGLLIINLYLRQFGFFSPGVVRVEYVMAGALWVALSAFGYFLYAITLRGWQRAEKLWGSNRARAITNLLGGLLVAAVVGVYIINYVRNGIPAVPRGVDWEILEIIFMTPLAMLGARDFAQRAWSVTRGEEKKWETPIWLDVTRLGLVVWALSWYATTAYPALPPMFGGGRPAVVTALVRSEVMPIFGSGSNQPTTLLVNYDLILDTPEWLVLTPHTGTTISDRRRLAIRIRRDDVVAISSRGEPLP